MNVDWKDASRMPDGVTADGSAAGPSVDVEGLRKALEAAVAGEVRFDTQSRAVYATDASNYRQVPVGAVLPRSLEDVVATVAACRRFGVPVTGRGGGTSLAGQCCNTGVMIDFSRHLNRVLDLDPDGRSAWVEPGCVLDDLRDAARPHGLTFGPDPSTHNHCTLGGMTGNNSCGVHSVMAGRTADNIEALEVLTYDGHRLAVGATGPAELERLCARSDRIGEIYRGLRRLRDDDAEEIRRRYPGIPRRVSGFNLDELLPEKGFHVARALVGTEGSCVTVLRIKCRLVPDPAERVLLVLGFRDVFAAGDAVPRVLQSGPVGLEGIDEKLTDYMRLKHMQPAELEMLPQGGGWLMAEFGADSGEAAAARARALMRSWEGEDGAPSMKLLTDADAQASLWKVRESGLPATAHVPGMPETHPGWEDAAVPPDRVGDYLREFRRLLDRYGYDCAIYGHFGDGCLHCRIDFGLSGQQGVDRYLSFIDAAADLVIAHGGSLSGEHGDGQARGALLEKMYGAQLVGAFQTFKGLWDPDWMMNPGKVVQPNGPAENLREGPARHAWQPQIRMALPQDRGDFRRVAARCVGVGKCRRHDSGTMCPSYRATGEEAYSTRGRARLLFEMLDGGVVTDRWRSGAVHDALDFCLACKACKHECPVQVDMAAYKAEFMYHHYKGRLRPRAAYAMGLIPWWARLGSHAPALANLATQTQPFAALAKRLAGLAPARSIPPLARVPFRRWFHGRPRPAPGSARRVLLLPDSFNAHFTPAPLQAAVEVLEAAGYTVEIPGRQVCCGRPLYAFGFLDLADRVWRRTLATLRPYLDEDIAIVGLEPSCVAAYRDELLEMRPDDPDAKALSDRVQHLGEFLQDSRYQPPALQGRAILHGHCHHRAVLRFDTEAELLRRTGLQVEVADSGCCGMAGDYGFRQETYDVAMRAGERSFLPMVRSAGEALLVADGFSCREQAAQATGRRPLTVAEVLAQGLRQ